MSFNTLLHIEEPVDGNELAGIPIGTYERTGARAWFEVRTQGGREYLQAQQMQSAATHQLRCVRFSGAHSRMRLTAGEGETPTRVLNVLSVVDENDGGRFLVWQCQEVPQ